MRGDGPPRHSLRPGPMPAIGVARTVRRTVRRRDRPSAADPCACTVPNRRTAVPYAHDRRNHPHRPEDDRRTRARRTPARTRQAALRAAAEAVRRRPPARRGPRPGDPGSRLAASRALRADAFDSVRPWLLTVGRRLAIDARRARQARPAEVGDAVLENASPVCADHAERAAATLDVREAVKTLTPEHREVLVLVYFQGASVAEAAEALGIPPGTVKSRAYYALRALRRVLPGYAADLH